MRQVFADTYYWIALLNDNDQGHAAAQAASLSLCQATIVTTQEVLSKVLTHFSGFGRFMRQSVAVFGRNILADAPPRFSLARGLITGTLNPPPHPSTIRISRTSRSLFLGDDLQTRNRLQESLLRFVRKL
jgi:hypothetical protein